MHFVRLIILCDYDTYVYVFNVSFIKLFFNHHLCINSFQKPKTVTIHTFCVLKNITETYKNEHEST